MRIVKGLLLLAAFGVIVAFGAAIFIGLGVYNVAADDPHWSMTYRILDTARTRSIATRAARIEVPPLDDPELIKSGAGNYAAMCVTCHLAPGASDTELSLGLYPTPPTWSELGQVDPREAFWVIKHGIKMSGMPAWGKSMDDQYLWGMVALLQQFPRMTAADYEALVTASPGHSHGGGETDVDGTDVGGEDEHHEPDAPRSSFEPIDDPLLPESDVDESEHDSPDHTH
jgi:mono/diheme cytochrome c family protein